MKGKVPTDVKTEMRNKSQTLMLQRITKTYIQDPVFHDFLGKLSLWWLIWRECLYRHVKVLFDSFFLSLVCRKSSYWMLPSQMSSSGLLPSFLVFPGANSTAASTHLVRSGSNGESGEFGLHHQITLDILVSLGSSGSIALLPWASSRLCCRGDLDCGRCPLMSVMGILQ